MHESESKSRTPRGQRDALLLALVLFPIPAILLAVSVQASIVGSAPVPPEATQLAVLEVPDSLVFERTRRAATAATGEVLEAARAHTAAVLLAQQTAALAQHQSLLDRPRRPPMTDELAPGEPLNRLLHRWRLDEETLLEMNPDLDLDALEAETPVVVWRYDSNGRSQSLGTPNRGRLRGGEMMPEGAGWVVRRTHTAWGARQTIDALVHATRVTNAEHPDGQELMIANLSRYHGGPLAPHRSHQSGRDVDVSYYQRTTEPPSFSHTRPRELDVERTWTFVRTLLLSHQVEYIFMSNALQQRLHEHALALGEHPLFLDEAFQIGIEGHRNRQATIRFAPGHHNHMHIRFACLPHEERCRP